jgi:hypothetical protein
MVIEPTKTVEEIWSHMKIYTRTRPHATRQRLRLWRRDTKENQARLAPLCSHICLHDLIWFFSRFYKSEVWILIRYYFSGPLPRRPIPKLLAFGRRLPFCLGNYVSRIRYEIFNFACTKVSCGRIRDMPMIFSLFSQTYPWFSLNLRSLFQKP